MVASIPIIAFVVLALASAFLISKKGFSGDVKTFIVVSVIFCIGAWIFTSWAFGTADTMILAIIFLIPAIGLGSVLLITLIILFIFALTSSSRGKDKETEADVEEQARQIERKIGEGK